MAGKKQFDMDTALDAAMVQFWRDGYADTSLDDLSRATGLNRSSIYASLGDKDALFLRCLDRYAARYGARYDTALSAPEADADSDTDDGPLAAVRRFFDVTLARIADPDLPDGCLIAQSAMAVPVLSPGVAAHAKEALGLQHTRLRAALKAGRLDDGEADRFAVHVAAVNQSLAVMSRAGATPAQLAAIVSVTLDALAQALSAQTLSPQTLSARAPDARAPRPPG
ncbi:TetR/AcrR family transcriptional regulator [Streptomyces sp. CA-111067]|uniref:TetR/AcrR family transcriptional regulator n=1 Tax=Streptomyces sp. CA-111067 TaxID=3240046 RepID=UPI003D96525D